MKYALVVYLMMHGQSHSFVVDKGLTADDCVAAIAADLPSDIPNDLAAALAKAPRVCELESSK
ncbi:hypothetical protein [Mesorhizobium sp. M1B.F.Ca.ET.045.04.1.1]|uniref:hypothetical protein n=1 Tax=Mesorhizobium sp. M1B.F.Ca.ET.045.04.1.1 TaxID=2493673 RepID=UPI000F76417D|nr:hypothetical protein [Mesorhizobium sp. M1B.F.Ca.ET.045.04.1.1]AZO29376.1 hypothetical protein EJ071_19615 [Mesorhizobium sp. M1B.F.Ca.ET.045.04.1.1]